MRNRRFSAVLALAATLALVGAACASNNTPSSGGGGSGTPQQGGGDLLAKIMDQGFITVSTDPKYAPQSFLDDQGQYVGFDIDVAKEIAKRLGVQVHWTAPAWNSIISGHWSGRWDMSVGSMTVTPERAQVLDFTPPYRYDPAGVAVYKTNTTINDVTTDLDGKTIGVCGGCTYEFYLEKTLDLPNATFNFVVDDANVKTYNTDTTAIEDLSLGDGARLDAVVSAKPTLEEAAKKGAPIRVLDQPLFSEPLAVAFDKSSELDETSLYKKVSDIIDQMHQDGTLTALSKKWYNGQDLTQPVS
ncbi:MAG: transporter substrate-binding domain-containing protein [Actinomycetota bacterium]|nr:transporter substrate-binding domain-containing protein [Actinomycetota bacterium]